MSDADRWIKDVFDFINMFDMNRTDVDNLKFQNTTSGTDNITTDFSGPTDYQVVSTSTLNSVPEGFYPNPLAVDTNYSSVPSTNFSKIGYPVDADQNGNLSLSAETVIEMSIYIPSPADDMVASKSGRLSQDDQSNDSDIYGFFDLPLLNQKSQIFRFLRQTARLLCDTNFGNEMYAAQPKLPIKGKAYRWLEKARQG